MVEGKSDVSFLSSFIEAEFVTTNGSEISKDTIEYLKKISNEKTIYVLTDPDYPGERIRKVLDEHIAGLKHCFINKEKAIKHGKVGVAESTKDEVLSALSNSVEATNKKTGTLTTMDLYNLGLCGQADSLEKRNKISKELRLGHCNAKTFLKRLNYCDINIDDLKKMLWTKKPTLKTLKHISI